MVRTFLVLAALGGGLGIGAVRAEGEAGTPEPAPASRVLLHLTADTLKRPHQTKDSLSLGWWLENGVKAKDQAYRITYSPDAGKTWRTVHTGGEPSHIWSLHGEESTKEGLLRVELVNADGSIAAGDEIRGVVIDDIQPEAAAETAPISKDRDIFVNVKVRTEGPSGLALLQLWMTRDGGRRWEYAGSSRDATKPFTFKGEKGRYGFSVTAVGGSKLVEPHPVPGDKPEAEIEIAPDEPMVKLQVGYVGRFPKAGDAVTFEWQVIDDDLPENPVTAEYRTTDGRWVEILKGGPAEGSHVWKLPSVSMAISDLRVRVRDVRGNVGEKTARVSCWIDADTPVAEILGPAVWDKEGEVEVQYRINETGSGIERAKMSYRIPPEGAWTPFADLPPAGGMARKMLEDGVYELAIEAADRAGNRLLIDAARKHRLVVDRTEPHVKVDAVSAKPEGIAVSWEAMDPNLGEGPVAIHVQQEGNAAWIPLKEALPAKGSWEGALPAGTNEGMGISLRVSAADLSGKSAAHVVALRVTGDVPTVRLKQARFVDVMKLLIEWESAGKNLAENPVDLKVFFWRGGETETLFQRTQLPVADSLSISLPRDLPASQIQVEVGCRNQWGARQFQSATLELARPVKEYPEIRITRVAEEKGKLRVGWEATGIDIGEKAVSIECSGEEGVSLARTGLPPAGEWDLEIPMGKRQSLKIRGVCTDNKGRERETVVFVVLSGGSGAPAEGIRIRRIVREGRRIVVGCDAAEGASPAAIEYRRAGGDWIRVPAAPDAAGNLSWEAPADWTGAVEIRVVTADGKTASAVETVALDAAPEGTAPHRPGTGTGRRPSARAVWTPGHEPTPAGSAVPVAPPADPLKPAREMLLAGRAEEAEQYLRVFLAKLPDSVDAHLLQVQALRFQGRKGAEIVDLYRRALAISPHNARILNDLGLYYLIEEGDVRQALAYFEEALGAGHTPEAHVNIGRARFQVKEYALAAAAFEKALAIDPRFTDARYFLARIYTETPLADKAKAKRLWETIRTESADDPERLGRAETELRRLR